MKNNAHSRSRRTTRWISLVVITGAMVFGLFNCNLLSEKHRNPEKSIAVLPFDDLSDDASQRWFTEGISDVIINQLSKISGLRVINRRSTQRYREKEKIISEIGKELGVNYVIDGTVQKKGDQIRIATHLIQVKNGARLWSDVYDNHWDEIFEVQTDIAQKVAENLQSALSPAETAKIEYTGTKNPEAWELYLKGNHLIQVISEENCWSAIDSYKQAIALDPDFPLAYSGMAFAYFVLTMWDVPEPDPTLIPVARRWAFKALELNETLGEPHYILGAISYHHDWDWKAAEQALKTGMELDPNNISGLTYYANFLTFMQRFEEAVSISEYSIKLNPLDPTGYGEMAFSLGNLGQEEKAFELWKKSHELEPEYFNAKWGVAYHYARRGENLQYAYDFCEEQLGRFNHDLQSIPAFLLGGMGEILALSGGQEQVEEILNELHRRLDEQEKDASYLALGRLYSVLGETEKALDFLEKSVEIREPFAFGISATPSTRRLHSNERFQDLLSKLGIQP